MPESDFSNQSSSPEFDCGSSYGDDGLFCLSPPHIATPEQTDDRLVSAEARDALAVFQASEKRRFTTNAHEPEASQASVPNTAQFAEQDSRGESDGTAGGVFGLPTRTRIAQWGEPPSEPIDSTKYPTIASAKGVLISWEDGEHSRSFDAEYHQLMEEFPKGILRSQIAERYPHFSTLALAPTYLDLLTLQDITIQ